MMLGTNYPENHLADDDAVSLLEPMSQVLRDADITFGNLEGTLSDSAEPEKKCKVPSHCYLFRSPARYASLLAKAGFDVISLANNHARDFGESGRSDTMLALTNAGIRHSGREGDIASWEVKGRRIVLVAFAPFKNSHDMLDINYAQNLVSQISANHDIVIVSIHAGAEGLDKMNLPFEEEFYYGENRGDAVAFAHAVIDSGADLVLGHGPHVPRAMELYQGRLIAYSLGNFCTYYGISVVKSKGLAPVLTALLDEKGQFISGRVISARQIRPGGPVLDKSQQASQLIRSLTMEDFPNGQLTLDNAGWLSIIKTDEHTVSKAETSD
jgi:poly-gamma-glutamate capsule biosynthesis protein CapA/YwtB (metallophosphatase superfamily)